jgi:hypothetical protein
MTVCGRVGELCAALVLVGGCSHNAGESESARSAEDSQPQAGAVEEAQSVEEAQGQVGAEAASSDWQHITPPEEPVGDDILQGARHYECSNGQRFTVDIQEKPVPAAIITKGNQTYFLPRVTKARFEGEEGVFRVTSPSRTSLALTDRGAWRSCVRD